MSKRPRPPDDLPADHRHNGHSGPAAAASRRADDRRDWLAAILADRWAVILKRFRDYMNRG
jgi:hypothetical protein